MERIGDIGYLKTRNKKCIVTYGFIINNQLVKIKNLVFTLNTDILTKKMELVYIAERTALWYIRFDKFQ